MAQQIVKQQMMNEQQRFVIVDPSVFVSFQKLDDAFKAMESLVQPTVCSVQKANTVIPSDLYVALVSIFKEEKTDATFQTLKEIFSKWLPFYDRNHIEPIVKELLTDENYRKSVQRFFAAFKPINGKEYTSNQDRIGEKTIHLKEAVTRFGETVGHVVFELLALSEKLKGVIISFGQRLANMAGKLGITVMTVHSRYKNEIKKKGKIKYLLRLSLYAVSRQSLRTLLTDLQISNLDVNLAADIAGLGIFVLADG
jgi:hypothetical protein